MFSISLTPKAGNEVIENVGQKVEIEGTLMEDNGVKVISVDAFPHHRMIEWVADPTVIKMV